MKGFIAALITLSLLIGGIVWNGIWVHRTLDRLMEKIETISETDKGGREKLTNELRQRWEDCKPILSVTVSHTEIESIDTKIVSMVTYAASGNESDFGNALAHLKEDLEYLHESESFSLEGII